MEFEYLKKSFDSICIGKEPSEFKRIGNKKLGKTKSGEIITARIWYNNSNEAIYVCIYKE